MVKSGGEIKMEVIVANEFDMDKLESNDICTVDIGCVDIDCIIDN